MTIIGIIGIALALTASAAPAAAAGYPEPSDSVWALVDAAAETDDEGRKKQILLEAEALARTDLSGHEDDVERRYTLAVVLGLRSNIEGGQTRVRAASALSAELEAILALDADHPGARHMLGRLHAGVRRMNRITRWVATNLLGGDELKKATWEAAEENLLFAERNDPEVSDHHLQLALLYRDTGRPGLAAQEVGHVMQMQASTAMELAVQREATEVWTALQPSALE